MIFLLMSDNSMARHSKVNGMKVDRLSMIRWFSESDMYKPTPPPLLSDLLLWMRLKPLMFMSSG